MHASNISEQKESCSLRAEWSRDSFENSLDLLDCAKFNQLDDIWVGKHLVLM